MKDIIRRLWHSPFGFDCKTIVVSMAIWSMFYFPLVYPLS